MDNSLGVWRLQNTEPFFLYFSCGSGNCNVWVGLTRKNGDWQFTDGSSFNFKPDDKKFNEGNSDDLRARLTPVLKDRKWNNKFNFMCKVVPIQVFITGKY